MLTSGHGYEVEVAFRGGLATAYTVRTQMTVPYGSMTGPVTLPDSQEARTVEQSRSVTTAERRTR